MSNTALWFSLFTNKDYISDDDPFADIRNINGVKNLEVNYKIILGELETYLSTHQMQSHFNTTMVQKPKSWKVQGLRGWCRENYKKQKYFSKTMALLNAIPNVSSISFNLLEPQSKIKQHSGDTNAIIRCHLGLKIPNKESVCALKVKDKIKEWKEGKVIAFTDAFTHEAWNLTNETRIILLFDIMKPEFLNQKNKICATIHTSFFLQKIANSWPKMYTINRKIYKATTWPFTLFFWIKFPLVNKINFIRYGVFWSSFYKKNNFL